MYIYVTGSIIAYLGGKKNRLSLKGQYTISAILSSSSSPVILYTNKPLLRVNFVFIL